MTGKQMDKRKKQMLFMSIAVALLLIILVVLLVAANRQYDTDGTFKEEIAQAVVENEEQEQKEEPQSEIAKKVEEAFQSDLIKLHMEGYLEEIFQGWEWVLQEELLAYTQKNEIEAANAVVLCYAGYETETQYHGFYVQLDDADGTILFAAYRPYEAKVSKTDKTIEDIRNIIGSSGDTGDDTAQDTDTSGEQTPVLTYAEMEIKDVPISLVQYLGGAAGKLPSELAGFLVSVGRIGDTYAVYDGNLEIENDTATFDLKLSDGVVVKVRFEKETGYFF